MTASNDGIKDYVTFDPATRKLSIKQITNNSAGLLLVKNDYTRTITGTIAPTVTMTNKVSFTATIKVTNPACETATIAFTPSGSNVLAASTYLLGASSGTVITLPTSVAVTPSSCNVDIVDTNTLPTGEFSPTLTSGKLTYTVGNKDANIGRWTFTRKRNA